MSEEQTGVIRHFVQWSIDAMSKLIIKLKNRITENINKRPEKPPDRMMSFIFFLTWLLYAFGVIWIFWWLSSVTVDSAKWALSTQVQATAAIFGLLIAAVALLWRRITDQEQRLRNDIYEYLKELSQPLGRTPPVPVLDVAYGDYLKWITEAISKKERIAKDAFRNLGRLWVIRFLSLQYRLRLRFGRYLTVGQTKELSKISKLSRESAIDMWEYYYKRPEDFIINMHETLDMVSSIVTGLKLMNRDSGAARKDKETNIPEECIRLNNVAYSIVYNDSKVIAENVKRTRLALRPRFYFTSLVLALAIIIGLCILTGIEGTIFPFSLNPSNIVWAVGIPIGLSIFGIALCLALIRNII